MLPNRCSVAGLLCAALALAVCPAGAQTLSGFGTDSAARAVQVNGQVSVLRDSTPWAVHVGSTVQVRQIIVTGADGWAMFQISDGSTFEVFPNSRVTFRANPGNWKDLLDLWLGRVKVHIEKLTGGAPNHNSIRTPTAVISVRGTTFDVSVEDTDSTLISVEEGQVAVQHAVLPSKEPKLLNGGDSLRVYRDQPLAKASPNRDAFARQALRAVEEALYRVIYRTPSAGGTRLPTGGGTGGGAPLPGDTDGSQTPPPPPPPPPPAQ